MIRLVIVDRRNTKKRIWQIFLKNEPDLKLVGFVQDGQAAIHYIEKIQPDIAIVNIHLPIVDGLTITRTLSQRCPDTQVILITPQDSQKELDRVLQVGARGYLLDNTEIPAIINVIRLVHQGYFHLDSNLAQKYIFKELKKKYTVPKKPQPNIAHIFEGSRFFAELKAIRYESKQINLILNQFEIRLKFLHKFSFFLILIIFTLVLAIILIIE